MAPSPFAVLLLSVVPGMGHLMLARTTQGVVAFVVTVVAYMIGIPLGMTVHAGVAIWAFVEAQPSGNAGAASQPNSLLDQEDGYGAYPTDDSPSQAFLDVQAHTASHAGHGMELPGAPVYRASAPEVWPTPPALVLDVTPHVAPLLTSQSLLDLLARTPSQEHAALAVQALGAGLGEAEAAALLQRLEEKAREGTLSRPDLLRFYAALS